MDFTIFSIGDSIFLEQVLISLAMISATDDFTVMVSIGLLIGVFSAVISGVASGGQKIEIQHVLLGWIIYGTMFVPTARVLIEDTYSGDVRVVDNVPIGPAAAGGMISMIGYKLTELFELGYAPIVPSITENEFVESLRVLTDIRNKAQQSAIWNGINEDSGGGAIDLQKSWTNYITDCSLKKVDLKMTTANKMYTEPYAQSLRFNSSLFGTELFITPGNPFGTNHTCTDAWAQLQAVTQFGNRTTLAFNAVLEFNGNNLAQAETSVTKIENAIDALIPVAVDTNDYMKMAVLEPILGQAAEKKYNLLQDVSASMMVNQAMQQRNTQWATEQTLFMSIVRPMLAFFEAFIYAISPIMAFVIVLGAQGIQLAGKYFALLIWIQLWMPLLSIVNLYIYSAASRSLNSYEAMGVHNWDSFYSLNAAADTMQHWIATGGLLASSTPAIALMLIYGSAVTATHLAGRLKSSDTIDEGYVTPAIKNNAPMANIDSMYHGDTMTGMMRTGGESTIGTAQISTAMQGGVSSARNNLSQETDQYTETLGHSITGATSNQEMLSRASDIGAAVSSSNSKIAQDARAFSKSLVDSNVISQDHANAAAGAFVASVGASGQVDVGKAVGMLGKMTGIPGAAILSKIGNMTGKESPAGIAGNVNATGRIQSQTTDTNGQKTSNSAQTKQDYTYGDSDIAKFSNDLSASLKEGNTLSNTNTWSSADASNLTKASSELKSASDTYQTMESLNTGFQSGTNFKLNQVAALAAGRQVENLKGTSKAQQTLTEGMSLQSDKMKEAASEQYKHYKTLGMDDKIAQNTANLSSLLNRANYSSETEFIKGAELAGNVISQATGQTPASNYGYNKNEPKEGEGLSFEEGDIQAKTGNLSGPSKTSNVDTSSVGSGVNSKPIPQGWQIALDSDKDKQEVQKLGAAKEQEMVAPAVASAARAIQRDKDTSTAAWAFGQADNAGGWIGRRFDSITGGYAASGEAELNTLSQKMYDYDNMSPEQQSAFRQQLQSGDDNLFQNTGAFGTVIKGFAKVGNTIGGIVMEGYEAYKGGENISESANQLSLQEKGAYLMGSAVAAAGQGAEAYSNFMEQHGSEFKSSMQQFAMDQYGLTRVQAGVFAESFDTNDQTMQQRIGSLYAENMTPDGKGGMHLTDENRALTEAMVERITDASTAGDQAGSYLQDIQRYNMLTNRVTPKQ